MDKQLLERMEFDLTDASSLSVQVENKEIQRFVSQASERSVADTRWLSWQGNGDIAFRQSQYHSALIGDMIESDWHGLSPWSRSSAKRFFDCVCVVLAMPLMVPMMLVIAAAVHFTSSGPILFVQERVGCHGRVFKILKFRTMEHSLDAKHHPITTSDNQKFTSIGPFLRRWKLDELPQIVNVLLGDMSLVGPRPKLPEHVVFNLPCRPGITGMATVVFAGEEKVLARIPKDCLDAYYHSTVLPLKRQLDANYMACATFLSDLRLLVNSVLRRWDSAAFDNVVLVSGVTTRSGENSFEWSGMDGVPHRASLKQFAERMGISEYLGNRCSRSNPVIDKKNVDEALVVTKGEAI